MNRSSGAQVRARRECFEAHRWSDEAGKIWLTCHICGGSIDPGKEPWEAEHIIAVTLGGSDHPDNVRPCHVKCHKSKTSKDITANAHCKRTRDKHFGLRRKGWNNKYKKKLNGEVVLRTGVK